MKKIRLLVSVLLLSIGLFGCQQNTKEIGDAEPPVTEAEVIERDFVYRLVTEKAEYDKNEPIKMFAELEYTGSKDEVEITHAASPFSFSMVETTRNYDIGYLMEEPLLSTKLIKGEPLREEYSVRGGYSSEDSIEYIDFMKQIMKSDFPEGHYVVYGNADFNVYGTGETGQEGEYEIKAQVEFEVKRNN